MLKKRVDFGFETTLSTKSYQGLVTYAKSIGYNMVLVFMWLESADLAKERVRLRVSKGGHNIPDEIIERRYQRGLKNFFALYSRLVGDWLFYNNSGNSPLIIAESVNGKESIINNEIWNNIKDDAL